MNDATAIDDRIGRIIAQLKAAVASARPEDHPRRLAAATWLCLAVSRLVMLIIRLEKGLLRPLRATDPDAARDSRPSDARGRDFRPPRTRGWLTDYLPEAGPLADAIADLLVLPAFRSRLAREASRFRSALDPLCRALALDLPEDPREAPVMPAPAFREPGFPAASGPAGDAPPGLLPVPKFA